MVPDHKGGPALGVALETESLKERRGSRCNIMIIVIMLIIIMIIMLMMIMIIVIIISITIIMIKVQVDSARISHTYSD